MKNKAKIFFLILWVGLMLGSGVWYLGFAERAESYDERENRNLAAAPEMSLSAFWQGGLSDALESWMLDRFWARGAALDAANGVKDTLSIATYEDSLAIMDTSKDELSSDELDQSEIEQMVQDMLSQPTPEPSPEPTPDIVLTPQPGEEVLETPQLTPEPTPEIPAKPEANIEDYPEYPGIKSIAGGVTYTWRSDSRTNVLAVASVIGRVANMLPEDGRLVYTMVPQSYIANNYKAQENKESFFSEAEEIVHAFTPDNVTALSAAAILDEPIRNGQYVFFRSDMHWSVEGTYLVYREMTGAAGIEPTAWEEFVIDTEEGFLGTYYRDNPMGYMAANPDTLTLVRPAFDLEFRRVTAPDEYKVIPLLNEYAAANDRYTVYLGGPAGPWSYIVGDNGLEENCLVICDSFGLAFVPMISTNYHETHYLDPRYYNYQTVGCTVQEMIEKYGITDVYVVVGDLHSYSSDFIITQLSGQLGDR